jgi:YspA, cpYpsA-related SLOG family
MEPKVVAIVGSRTFTNYDLMVSSIRELENQHQFSTRKVVSGGARGADALARKFAITNEIPIEEFKPDWSTGRGAGIVRNTDIVNAADVVIAFWDGNSRGTLDSINKGKAQGKQVFIVRF